MAGLWYFRQRTSDWISNTRGLSPAARGVYMDLICASVTHGGALHFDEGDAEQRRWLRVLLGLREDRQWRPILDELEKAGKIVRGHGLITVPDAADYLERAGNKRPAAPRPKQPVQAPAPSPDFAPTADKIAIRSGSDADLMPIWSPSDGGTIEENQSVADHKPIANKQTSKVDDQLYAFEGEVVRLTPGDFARWRDTFGAIPDIVGELRGIDRWCAKHWPVGGTKRKRWFQSVAAMLDRANRRYLAQRQQEPERLSTSAEYFAELEAGIIH